MVSPPLPSGQKPSQVREGGGGTGRARWACPVRGHGGRGKSRLQPRLGISQFPVRVMVESPRASSERA
eukprot:9579208-Lingulodinium_polyedra.AAC.1